MSLNARVPRPYNSLPKHEQEAIKQLASEWATEAAQKLIDEQDIATVVQVVKFACVTLYDYQDFTESDLYVFLGNLKNTLRSFRKVDDIAPKLDERINQIFPNGFPQEFVEKLQRGD
jgi:hypothetical protein